MKVVLKLYPDEGLRVERYGNVVEEISFFGLPQHVREQLHLINKHLEVEWDEATNTYGAVLNPRANSNQPITQINEK